jgi:hypothetical protein
MIDCSHRQPFTAYECVNDKIHRVYFCDKSVLSCLKVFSAQLNMFRNSLSCLIQLYLIECLYNETNQLSILRKKE